MQEDRCLEAQSAGFIFSGHLWLSLKANRRSSLSNPWLSLWMSAANSWAGAARGFWTAEMHRQQSAMMNEMIRQTVRFWTRTWTVSIADHKSKRR
jgi:hypothetical protein